MLVLKLMELQLHKKVMLVPRRKLMQVQPHKLVKTVLVHTRERLRVLVWVPVVQLVHMMKVVMVEV